MSVNFEKKVEEVVIKTHGSFGSSSNVTDTQASPSYVTSDDRWGQDTIHYLSPASTARTEYEGDFDYRRFLGMPLRILPPDMSDGTVYTDSTISCDESQLQRALAIIKPDAMKYKDVALKAIIDAGFHIVNERTLHLTPEQVSEVYAQHYGCPIFPNLVVSMSIGPLLVLSLSALNAVDKWKNLIGPYKAIKEEWFLPLCVRRRFGPQQDVTDALHASETLHEAKKENRYFYPDSILEPLINEEDRVIDYCKLYVHKTLLNGLVELVKKKPIDPVIFLAEWLLLNNPFQPRLPYLAALAPT